jgi:hypothetical protein
MKKTVRVAILKSVLAVLLLGASAAFFGSRMAPDLPTLTMLGRVATIAFVVAFVLIVGIGIQLSWNQAMLHRGARDPQWYWFNADPVGLQKPETESKEQESKVK